MVVECLSAVHVVLGSIPSTTDGAYAHVCMHTHVHIHTYTHNEWFISGSFHLICFIMVYWEVDKISESKTADKRGVLYR